MCTEPVFTYFIFRLFFVVIHRVRYDFFQSEIVHQMEEQVSPLVEPRHDVEHALHVTQTYKTTLLLKNRSTLVRSFAK